MSCQKPSEDITDPESMPILTPLPSLIKMSDEPIAFVFLESEKDLPISIYHHAAYLQMDTQGYNVSSIYATEGQDLADILSQLELNGVKYIIVTSELFSEEVALYKHNNNSSVIFLQYKGYNSDDSASYQVKLYEYYYLAGVALGEMSITKYAGFIADNPTEQTIRCINAFALGMKSVDNNAVVMVSWADYSEDKKSIENLVENLSYQKCDVYAYFMTSDLVETVANDLGAYYMTMYAQSSLNVEESLIIKPKINLDTYYSNIINSGNDGSAYKFEYLGIKDSIVSYELSTSTSDIVKNTVNSAYTKIRNEYEVFSGPIYNEIGLVVPDGISLPKEDILDMLWFVDNVLGELPAG